jgi:hypothetical protein
MSATRWKRLRVVVDLAVRDDSLSEKDFRWSVERALAENRTFDQVIAAYRARGAYARNLTVKVDRKVRAKEGEPSMEALQRKLDKAYEMAGLARQDHDRTDEARWMGLAAKLKGQITDLRAVLEERK